MLATPLLLPFAFESRAPTIKRSRDDQRSRNEFAFHEEPRDANLPKCSGRKHLKASEAKLGIQSSSVPLVGTVQRDDAYAAIFFVSLPATNAVT